MKTLNSNSMKRGDVKSIALIFMLQTLPLALAGIYIYFFVYKSDAELISMIKPTNYNNEISDVGMLSKNFAIHCLNRFDGSQDSFIRGMKRQMRFPKSFMFKNNIIHPVDIHGRNKIKIDFIDTYYNQVRRFRSIEGYFDNKTCRFISANL